MCVCTFFRGVNLEATHLVGFVSMLGVGLALPIRCQFCEAVAIGSVLCLLCLFLHAPRVEFMVSAVVV